VSVVSKLDVKGLARDPSAFVADSAGLLRRAENVVLRSEGVAESRPNFDLLREDTASDTYPRSLYEFKGSVYSVESDGDFLTWKLKNELGAMTPPETNAFHPPNYDPDETSFAQARGNLYLSGLLGTIAVESREANPRFSGSEMVFVTDYAQPSTSAKAWGSNYSGPRFNTGVSSYVYRFVYVKKDSNGYIRRSPPTAPFCFSKVTDSPVFGSGTRMYLPSYAQAGDQVEYYRSISVVGQSPRTDCYLSVTYTVLSADVVAGYFKPPSDTTPDNELGAELYTNTTQTGEASEKYPPPVARHLAWWSRCMWYGGTIEKSRISLDLRNLFRAGVVDHIVDNGDGGLDMTTVSGTNAVTVADTTQWKVGQYLTLEPKFGPAVADATFPALTYITNISGATTMDISANALASGTVHVWTMNPFAPTGLIGEFAGAGTYTSGSPTVTGLADTRGYRAGMYWTDSSSGPTVAGAKVPAGTKILNVASPTSITMTKNALASGSSSANVGDILTITRDSDARDFYAWGLMSGLGSPDDDTTIGLSIVRPWATPRRCFGVASPKCRSLAFQVTISNLVEAINYETQAAGTPFVHAIATGIVVGGVARRTNPTDDYGNPEPITSAATGLTLESTGGALTSIQVDCTAPASFTPTPTALLSDFPVRPNRVWFSDLDEPESVPVVNFIDVGLLDEPIQSLVTLRNCLLVFKTDGLWRITGSGPSSWTVEQVDTTLRLVNPQSVAVMNGIAYAWCDRGFFQVDESSATSLSANAIDVELRTAAAFVLNQARSHGVFVATHRQRNFVILGVPSGDLADCCAKVYCFSVTTGQWSEWPVAWNTACSAFYGDKIYVARNEQTIGAVVAVASEIRESIDPRGYDREYGPLTASYASGALTATITTVHAGSWIPAIGDFLGVLVGDTTAWRRILDVTLVSTTYTLTLEAGVTGASTSISAREGAVLKLEWHPETPSGAPVGSVCRELQPQVDLRDGAQTTDVTIPRHVGGGSSELSPTLYTNVSNKDRLLSIQPLRFGTSRQIARAANLAPYLETSDIFPIRVLGMSQVFEGTSEKTTR